MSARALGLVVLPDKKKLREQKMSTSIAGPSYGLREELHSMMQQGPPSSFARPAYVESVDPHIGFAAPQPHAPPRSSRFAWSAMLLVIVLLVIFCLSCRDRGRAVRPNIEIDATEYDLSDPLFQPFDR